LIILQYTNTVILTKDVDRNCETNGIPLVKTNKQLQTKVYTAPLTDLMMDI
jgi:hypothetical protein